MWKRSPARLALADEVLSRAAAEMDRDTFRYAIEKLDGETRTSLMTLGQG